jgi:hypothetical protein
VVLSVTRDEQIREEILGALACLQGALTGDQVVGAARVQVTAACSAMHRANLLVRPMAEVFPFPGHSVKVKESAGDYNPALDGYEPGDPKRHELESA